MKYIIYARTNDSKLVKKQLNQLKTFAKKQGFNVYKAFSEQLPRTTVRYPIFEKTIKFLKENKADALLISSFDRIPRKSKYQIKILDLLENKKKKIRCIKNPEHIQDIIIINQLMVNSYERLAQSQRIKRGIKTAKDN